MFYSELFVHVLSIKRILIVAGIYGVTMGKSIGSGTIIDPDGTILTCAHVVVDFQGVRASSKGNVSHLCLTSFKVLYKYFYVWVVLVDDF